MRILAIALTFAGALSMIAASVSDVLKLASLKFVIITFLSGSLAVSVGSALLLINSPRRKRIENISLVVALVLIVFGYISTKIPLLGARLEIMVGVFILCFFYGTLALKSKFEKWKLYTRSRRDAFFLSLFDYLGIMALVLGMLFKFQSWPGANNMMSAGMVILAISVFAWNQKFKREVVYRKEAEDKVKESLQEIELQKKKVEEKQKEIIDSIRYARRIQQSLLPKEKYLNRTIKRLTGK
ncbi:MAG: hypothetical protein AB1458_05820 [Bacteroidota bacterium]